MFNNRKAIKMKNVECSKLPSLNCHCSSDSGYFPHCQSSWYVQNNNHSKWYDENYNSIDVVIHLHVILLDTITWNIIIQNENIYDLNALMDFRWKLNTVQMPNMRKIQFSSEYNIENPSTNYINWSKSDKIQFVLNCFLCMFQINHKIQRNIIVEKFSNTTQIYL